MTRRIQELKEAIRMLRKGSGIRSGSVELEDQLVFGLHSKKGSGANSLSIRVQWSFRKLRIDCGQTGEHGRVVCRSALRQGSDHFMRALVLSPDDDSGAMLLERCLPRTTLRSQPESARDGIIAAVLNRVWESSTETIGV